MVNTSSGALSVRPDKARDRRTTGGDAAASACKGNTKGAEDSIRLTAALDYAAKHGWHVFPCHTVVDGQCSCGNSACASPGKHPRIKEWQEGSPTDPEQIRRWWTIWSDANIGVATGTASGVVALDVDPRHGGDEALAELVEKYGALPETPESLTGGGGRHILFMDPGGNLRNSVSTLGSGLDIRANGGFIIAPPSLHNSGRRYEWEVTSHPHDVSLAKMPDWMLTLLRAPSPAEPKPGADISADIVEGERNTTLFRIACALRRNGLQEHALHAAIAAMNQHQCKPPLDDKEVERIAASASKDKPGNLSEGADAGAPSASDTTGNGAIAAELAEIRESTFRKKHPESADLRLVQWTNDNTKLTGHVDTIAQELRDRPGGPYIFQRARHLVHIAKGIPGPYGLTRPADAPVIVAVTKDWLYEQASLGVQWAKFDGRSRQLVPLLMPPLITNTLLARGEWNFPRLEGLVTSPTLRPDGTILAAPGYDPAMGLYLDFNGATFPAMPHRPSLADARTALGALQEAVSDFPWQDDAVHFSAALAAILSLVGRFAIEGNVPLFAVRATTRGSGKGLLIDVMCLIGTGRQAPRWPQATEDEEERKRLLTLGLDGDPVVHFDNVTLPFGNAPLDAALTGPTYKDRILGKNESREVPMDAVFFASGNNMSIPRGHGQAGARRSTWTPKWSGPRNAAIFGIRICSGGSGRSALGWSLRR